uniref:Acyl-[acyl-carrier-protein] hydrolase n=1 Tax=Araucaria cunninghamii TaxID=56994 RepID=A0A0D6R026_ARACU
MVVAAAASMLMSSGSPGSTGATQHKISSAASLEKSKVKEGSPQSVDIKPKTTYKGVQVNGNAMKINGTKVNGTAVDVMKSNVGLKDFVDEESTAKSRINMLPDWSMLLAAIATIILAAEKQWTNFDWKPKRPDMFGDVFRLGRFVEDSLVFRQNFAIRSYEVGADKTASIETLMNHLQETALNHVWLSGLAGDGFGATLEMSRRNLMWVVARMQIQVESYPLWGDIVEIDTWVGASGKNGMRRDWLVRDCKTNEVLTRATSTWVMMNRKTRKLSKIPDAVREEIQPYFTKRQVIVAEDTRKLNKLEDDTAEYVCSNLTPRWSDLDVNQHVNNVKYIGWILEGLPTHVLEANELASITLEYRRECGPQHMLQSLASPLPGEENGSTSVASLMHTDEPPDIHYSFTTLQFAHLLRLQDGGSEILRARTEWRPKGTKNIHHLP